ncbi:MAG: O-antigen ligase family protein [Erysipelotrichales bacterium]|nr:O-antigen ligase family protein [Erysipelotrichales bacterium]
MHRWREKAELFFKSEFYPAIISFLILFGWQFSHEFNAFVFEQTFHFSIVISSIVILLYFALFAYAIYFKKDGSFTFPLIINLLFATKIHYQAGVYPAFQIILAGISILGFIGMMIRHGNIKNGKLSLGLFLLALASFLSVINVPIYTEVFLYLAVFSYALYFLLYLGIINTTETDTRRVFSITVFYTAILVMAQTFILYFDNGWFNDLDGFHLFYGWGISNDAAIILASFLPFMIYLFLEKKLIIYRLIVTGLLFITMIMTLSRGGTALIFLMGIPCLIFLIKHKIINKRFLVAAITFAAIASIFFLLNTNFYYHLRHRIFNEAFAMNGRLELFSDALRVFSRYPLFGSSVLGDRDTGNRFIVYHSLYFNTLAVFGLFGLFAMIVHFIQKYKLIYKNFGTFALLLFFFVFITDLYGLLDNTYGNLQYTAILIIALAVFEKSIPEKESSELLIEQSA